MAEDKKYTAKEAAIAILTKTHEILKKSEIAKYETMNSKKLGYKLPDAGKHEQEENRDFEDLEVKPGKSKTSNQKRLEKQKSPSKNPKEEAEGNNPEWGDKPKALGKAENPDEKEDAELGEDVEHLCEDHFKENATAEKKEGHKLVAKSECMKCNLVKPSPSTGQGDTLEPSKKEREWQMDKSEFSDLQKDLEALEPMLKAAKMDKKYEGFKAVEESAKESGASDPAAVAAAAGRKKYGKEAFQHAAAEGKKMGKGSDYPQELASKNIKQAREGEHEAKSEDMKGHIKLAKFMGMKEYKRKMNKCGM